MVHYFGRQLDWKWEWCILVCLVILGAIKVDEYLGGGGGGLIGLGCDVSLEVSGSIPYIIGLWSFRVVLWAKVKIAWLKVGQSFSYIKKF